MQEDLQQHRTFMERAIQEMSNSPGSTKVGAVLVVDGEIVATGHKVPGCHAERAAIEQAKANGIDLRQAVLYTTLEPCVQVKETQSKACCSSLILDEGIPGYSSGTLTQTLGSCVKAGGVCATVRWNYSTFPRICAAISKP